MSRRLERAGRAAPAAPLTVRSLIASGARRLTRARVFFGHGTDNAWDEAASLTLYALGLPPGGGAALYRGRVSAAGAARAAELIGRRIAERIPAPYLTGVTWFAGLQFAVDARVLVPRSPLAELIERGFAPWAHPARRAAHSRSRHRLGLHRHRLREGAAQGARRRRRHLGCGARGRAHQRAPPSPRAARASEALRPLRRAARRRLRYHRRQSALRRGP